MAGHGTEKKLVSIYSYIPSLWDSMRLAEVLESVTWAFPHYMEITFRHFDMTTNCFCVIFKLSERYLLKAWRINEKKMGYYPIPQIDYDPDDDE